MIATPRLVLVAACALLDGDGRVLVTQRPPGKAMAGLWEFPGGKLEAGERPEQAIIREMREELGVELEEAALTPVTFASHAYPDFHLLMPLFACRAWAGKVRPLEGQAVRWVLPEELARLAMPPADGPLIAPLAAVMRSAGTGGA